LLSAFSFPMAVRTDSYY